MKDRISQAQAVFSRFAPWIRNYIYQSGWDELRAVQIDAAEAIFHTEDHLLITSATASGKTEAAFFPILSLMAELGAENCTVLYISPLKALINDQHSRMDLLLRESGLPVTRWHGDVSRSHKEGFLKHPAGILQITPESLESMLIHRANDLPRLFAHLKFIVIDEVHALMGSDRGSQILCQMQRIAKSISYDPRRIALSATIGDTSSVSAWLSGGSLRKTTVIRFDEKEIAWKLGLEHVTVTEKGEAEGADPAATLIYRATAKEKCVVFSNSREETEEICADLRSIAAKKGEEDRFYIHHGNLSAAIREETEDVLKNSDRPLTACATVTLELGIDIGTLNRIVNQGAPASVSSFLQRIGRSGRRGQAPEMLMVFREEEALPNAPLYQLIPWELLQGIAIIELYRKERWIEPGDPKKKPASLLYHQTLSCLASKGSMSAAKLAAEVLSLSPFSQVTREEYRALLGHMVRQNDLELTEEKELIPGLRGEKKLNSFKFYAVFKDSEDFTVRHGSEEIGTITATPPVGERFALAGRVWEVEETDVAKRLVFVRPVEGKMKISWPGEFGNIHTRILEKMREILCSDETYPYLLPAAAERLEKARALSRKAGMGVHHLIHLGGTSYVLFPWLGTRSFRALKRYLSKYASAKAGLYDVHSAGSYYVTFKSSALSREEIASLLREAGKAGEPLSSPLTVKTEYPVTDKYDSDLPQELLLAAYEANHLDPVEAALRLSQLK